MGRILGVFDGAYVVNRDEDTERMRRTQERLDLVGIPFSRYPAVCFTDRGKFKSAGSRGNLITQLAIVQTAREKGLESVLIMEDDVVFREDFCELWSRIAPDLASREYDLFFAYNWWNQYGDRASLALRRIQQTVCSHFWAIHSRFYEGFISTVLANNTKRRPAAIDGIFTGDRAVLYSPTYNLVGQDEGVSLVAEGSCKPVRWHAKRHRPRWM